MSEQQRLSRAVKREFLTADEIFRSENKCRVETEAVLPDYKESIGRILYTDGVMHILKKEAYKQGDGIAVNVSGECVFTLVYITETGEADISSVSCTVPFEQTFKSNADTSDIDTDGMYIICECKGENISCRLSGPRKMTFKADAVTGIAVKANRRVEYCLPAEDNGMHTLFKDIDTSYMSFTAETDGVLTEQIRLPKEYLPIGEMLDKRISLAVSRASAGNDRIFIDGTCELFGLYYPDRKEEKEPISFFQPIDFSFSIGAEGCREGDKCEAYLEPLFIKELLDLDEEGETRVINTEIGYYVNARVIRDERVRVVSDCYSEEYCLDLTEKESTALSSITSFEHNEEMTFSFKPKKDDIKSIESIFCLSEVKNCQSSKGILCADIELRSRYFAVCSENESLYDEQSSEIKAEIKLDKAAENALDPNGEGVKIEMSCRVLGAEANISDGEVKVRVHIFFNIALYRQKEEMMISDILVSSPRDREGREGNIVFYYPDSTDTLWSVGKKYAVGSERLMKLNSIEADSPLPRVMLIK